ncbi:HNH endonuclease [Archangium sp.]
MDHVTPKAKGGKGVPENGQVLCRDCNLEKGSKAP